MRRMLITLMVLIVAKKSRTYFSFSYSANEPAVQELGGREHSQAASSSWAMEMFHTIDVMLSL